MTPGSCAAAALRLLVLLLPLAGASTAARGEEVSPQTAFFEGNQAYAAGRYGDAVRAYRSVLDAGWESGALDFNLGNALVKDGQLARGIASYERARKLLPRDPDVQANLTYARELAQVTEEAPPIWQRIAFPFAGRATSGEIALAAGVCWWALWLLLAARLLVPRWRPGLGRAALAAGIGYLIFAGNLGLRLAEVELRDGAVVVAPGVTSVRFEPSETGTEHFPAAAGASLEVLETRDRWLLVRRADGRRGWVPATAVERL